MKHFQKSLLAKFQPLILGIILLHCSADMVAQAGFVPTGTPGVVYTTTSPLTIHTNLYIGKGFNGSLNNVAIGPNTLPSSSLTGDHNIGIGTFSLNTNTSGGANIGVGANTLRLNSSGGGHVALGENAMERSTSDTANIAMGYFAMQFLNGSHNIAVGEGTMRYNVGGRYNTIVGSNSYGYASTTGSYNCALGGNSMLIYTGNYNLTLGYGAQVSTGVSNQLSIQNVIYGSNMAAGTGNVGIGLVPGSNALKPGLAKLEVGGTLKINTVNTIASSVNYLCVDGNGFVVQAPPSASGTASSCSLQNYVPKVQTGGSTTLTCSQIIDDGSTVAIGTALPAAGVKLHVNGAVRLENLPVNPGGALKVLLIDPSGDLYVASGSSLTRSSSTDVNLDVEINDLKSQVRDLKAIVDFLLASSASSSSEKVYSVFPNPATTSVRVELKNTQSVNTQKFVEVRSLDNKIAIAKTAFSGSIKTINTSSLIPGSYFVVISDATKILQTEKIQVVR